MREKTVADRIRGRSVENHIRTRDWAKLFSITERTWQNWMADPEHLITLGRIKVIAARLDTTVAVLMGEDEG